MNSKKKGNAGENNFSNWLQSKGIKAYRNSSSGGNQWKSDVHNSLDINFEVKTCKKINLLKCWKQTDRDSSLSRTQPMLAVHFDGMRENEWLMVLHSEDWMELIENQNKTKAPPKIETPNNREMKWAAEKLKTAVSNFIKYIE